MTTEQEFNLSEQAEVELFGEKPVRWYQIAARNQVERYLESKPNARVLIVLPTGSGKTLTSGICFTSQRIRNALGIKGSRAMKILFLAHKHRLLTQAERELAAAENVELRMHSVFQDLPSDFDWDLACLDESHHEAMTTIQYHLDKIGSKPILGMTATPERADGCLIKFDYIVEPISREQAVREGWLAETSIHSFVDGSEKDKTPILTDILTNFASQMGQTMIFVKTKIEVAQVVHVLRALGYDAVGILSQTERELNALLDSFSVGTPQFIVNCYKINEGVDVKGCTDVVLGRTFGSYTQLNQVIGRASRPDSDCNVWELINPLSDRNLDTTVIVGTPAFHRLMSKERGDWVQREFDYTSSRAAGHKGGDFWF